MQKTQPIIGVIGVGAVGGYYGGRLAQDGNDVHFLLRSDYEHVKNNGLCVDSKDGDFHLTSVNAHNHWESMPICDIMLIALKGTQNNILVPILKHRIKSNGIIVLLQNGIDLEAEVQSHAPGATLISGLCFICSNKVGPGHICHLDYGKITLGEFLVNYKPAGETNTIKKITQLFSNAGISVGSVPNLGKARWEKLVWNIMLLSDMDHTNQLECPFCLNINLKARPGNTSCPNCSAEFEDVDKLE